MLKRHFLITASAVTLILASRTARGQTYVQLPDLDPQNAVGPRLTRTVAWNKLSRFLFAQIDPCEPRRKHTRGI
jgi:hypothetical protein